MDYSNPLVFKVFDQLRFPLIVLVVYIHSIVYPVNYETINFADISYNELWDLMRLSLGNIISGVAVPVFFFMSGYLFFLRLERWNWTIYKKKLKNRIKTLLIPYFLWNSLAIFFSAVILCYSNGMLSILDFLRDNHYLDLFWSCNASGIGRLNEIGLSTSNSFPYLIPLWYLRELFVLFLLSPLLFFVLRKFKWGGVLLLFLNYAFTLVNYPGFHSGAFFFYSLGVYFKIFEIDPLKMCWHNRSIILILSCLLLFFEIRYFNPRSIMYNIFVFATCIATINIATYFTLRRKSIPQILTRGVFFIFLCHTLYVDAVTSFLIRQTIGCNTSFQIFLGYIISPMINISICLFIFYFLYRHFPRVLAGLTGGRL